MRSDLGLWLRPPTQHVCWHSHWGYSIPKAKIHQSVVSPGFSTRAAFWSHLLVIRRQQIYILMAAPILLPSLSPLSECLPRFRHYLDAAAVGRRTFPASDFSACRAVSCSRISSPAVASASSPLHPDRRYPLPITQGPPLHTTIKTPALS